jgi:hypothetical protein
MWEYRLIVRNYILSVWWWNARLHKRQWISWTIEQVQITGLLLKKGSILETLKYKGRNVCCVLPFVSNLTPKLNSGEGHRQEKIHTFLCKRKAAMKMLLFCWWPECMRHCFYTGYCTGRLAEIDGCPVKFGCWLQRESERDRDRDWNYQSTNITVVQQMMPTC